MMQLQNRKIVYIAMLSAGATVVAILERFIPMPIPFLKLGLANIFIIFALFIHPLAALTVIIIKIFFSSIIFGGIFQPITIMQIVGGISGLIGMYLIIKSNIKCSLLGISIIGAFIHNITMLFTAGLIAHITDIMKLYSIFAAFSLISGGIIGIATIYLIKSMYKRNINYNL
jgi:heptaprenyl diphosphate synthase